ncbi:MAG: hypothetical protein AVDCRST_MAG73-328, partial [uncultured Thermomicrobiales bacterium]
GDLAAAPLSGQRWRQRGSGRRASPEHGRFNRGRRVGRAPSGTRSKPM